jgi:hypothetical protein
MGNACLLLEGEATPMATKTKMRRMGMGMAIIEQLPSKVQI